MQRLAVGVRNTLDVLAYPRDHLVVSAAHTQSHAVLYLHVVCLSIAMQMSRRLDITVSVTVNERPQARQK